VSDEPSTCEAGGKRKEREKLENNPCTFPTRDKEKSRGAQTGLLQNLHRLDTMIVEEVAKIGRHTITGRGACFVECRTSRTVGALVTPWRSGMVAIESCSYNAMQAT
jgi:hypothetical protein